jgi:hypothetical protein
MSQAKMGPKINLAEDEHARNLFCLKSQLINDVGFNHSATMPTLELHQRQGVYLEVQIFREFLIHRLQTWRPTQVSLSGLFRFFMFKSLHHEAHYVKAPCKSLILSPKCMEYHLCCRQSLLCMLKFQVTMMQPCKTLFINTP